MDGLEAQSVWAVRTESGTTLSEQEREDQFENERIEYYVTTSGWVDEETISVRVKLVHFPSGQGWRQEYRGMPTEIESLSAKAAADIRSYIEGQQ
ncbi:MAG: hypothetical protein WBM34_07975 [Woeseiaceae bacterium]